MSSPQGPGPDLDALLDRDPEAVDRWYRAEHPGVWKLCFGFLADAAEADDVAQDAMLRMLDRLPSWDTRRSWGGWRNALVLNLCRDRLRRRSARRRAEEGADFLERTEPLPDPASVVARRETAAALESALGVLSPREREAFVLRELEGRPTAEVARTLGIGESSVRSLLVLARRRLRTVLAARLGSPGGLDG